MNLKQTKTWKANLTNYFIAGCFDNTKIATPEFYHIIPNEPKAETMGSCFQSCLEVKTPYFGIQVRGHVLLEIKIDDYGRIATTTFHYDLFIYFYTQTGILWTNSYDKFPFFCTFYTFFHVFIRHSSHKY